MSIINCIFLFCLIFKILYNVCIKLLIFPLQAGKTALHVSSEYGHINVVELLMSKKAYANAKTKVNLSKGLRSIVS